MSNHGIGFGLVFALIALCLWYSHSDRYRGLERSSIKLTFTPKTGPEMARRLRSRSVIPRLDQGPGMTFESFGAAPHIGAHEHHYATHIAPVTVLANRPSGGSGLAIISVSNGNGHYEPRSVQE